MADRIIAMPGSGHFDLRRLKESAAEFGFRVETAEDSRQIEAGLNPSREIAAILFHRDALGPRSSWFDTIWALRSDLPGVRLVACHGFGEEVDWELLSSAGAYHVLWLPFKESELRQCLGFIWDAERAAAESESEAVGTQTPLYRIPMGRAAEFAPQLRSCAAA
jgi:hypothetical protein